MIKTVIEIQYKNFLHYHVNMYPEIDIYSHHIWNKCPFSYIEER